MTPEVRSCIERFVLSDVAATAASLTSTADAEAFGMRLGMTCPFG